MGIQVTVMVKDLPAEFQTKQASRQVVDSRCHPDCEVCGGYGCYTTVQELQVKIPGVGWVNSYCDVNLVFDNKNANNNIVDVLKEWNVPHIRN